MGGIIKMHALTSDVTENLSPRKQSELILENYRTYLEKRKLNELRNYSDDDSSLKSKNKKDDLFFERVGQALLILNEEERMLLHYRYLENGGNTFDYLVKDKLGVSERTYYRIKANALNKFHKLLF